jgi:hypothetical protein
MDESIKDRTNPSLEQPIQTDPLETSNILDSSMSASEHEMPGLGDDERQSVQKELQFDESTGHEKFSNQKNSNKTAQETLRNSKYVEVFKLQAEALHSPLYEKVVLKDDIGYNPVYTDDVKISRAPGTTFRIGDEVFICFKSRNQPERRHFLFFGLVWEKGDVKYFPCILHDERSKITRTAPLIYIAHVPNGIVAGTNTENVEAADKIVFPWMQEAKLLGHPLSFWDSGSTARNTRKVLPKRFGDQIYESVDLSSSTPCSMQLTPPFGKRIEKSMKQLMQCNLTKGVAKIENTGNAKLSVENNKLKDDIKYLKKQVAALSKENDSLRQELRDANINIGKNDAFAEVSMKLDVVNANISRISGINMHSMFGQTPQHVNRTKRSNSHSSGSTSSSDSSTESGSSNSSSVDETRKKKKKKGKKQGGKSKKSKHTKKESKNKKR